MGDHGATLVNSYQQLLELSELQLQVLRNGLHDLDQLNDMLELEERKKVLQTSIEQLALAESQQLDMNQRNQIVGYIERMQTVHEELKDGVTNWYDQDSKSLKQVSTHRKTMQAYGGLNNSDIISYFFDEKK